MGSNVVNPEKGGGRWKCKGEKMIVRCVCGCMLAVVLAVLLAILIIWLVLRPTKPRYYLQDATVLHFNLSGSTEPYEMSSVLQVTVASRNPNGRIGIYYDTQRVYAVYKWQRVTLASTIPPYYQGHKDVSIWSPVLYGTSVPISPYIREQLGQDENAGLLLLNVRIDGRLRWKVGSWTSGRYHIHVNCPAYLVFTRPDYTNTNPNTTDGMQFRDGNGIYMNPIIHLQQQNSHCSVDV